MSVAILAFILSSYRRRVLPKLQRVLPMANINLNITLNDMRAKKTTSVDDGTLILSQGQQTAHYNALVAGMRASKSEGLVAPTFVAEAKSSPTKEKTGKHKPVMDEFCEHAGTTNIFRGGNGLWRYLMCRVCEEHLCFSDRRDPVQLWKYLLVGLIAHPDARKILPLQRSLLAALKDREC